MRIRVTRLIEAPASRVWGVLADLERHRVWMIDARSIEFQGDQRRGDGTRMVVGTKVGPFQVDDMIEVVSWKEGELIGVRHHGLIRGRGSLLVTPTGQGSLVCWEEDLRFPWWLGGGLTALITRPVLRRVWRRSLDRLAEMLTAP